MADYITTDTELTSIANAIRTKGGTSATLEYPTAFVNAINDLTINSGVIEIVVSQSANTSVTISNANITANHVVANACQYIPEDVTWTTSSGSLVLSCPSGIPAMTLYLSHPDS